MRKEKRMLWKLMVILFGVAALIVCMLSGIRIVTELDRKADAISQKEAAVLMQALCEEVLSTEEPAQEGQAGQGSLEACRSLLKEWEAAPEDALVYGTYKEVLQILPGALQQDSQRSNKQSVGRAEFYDHYFILVEQYGVTERICRKEVVLLSDGAGAVVNEPEREPKQEENFTADGDSAIVVAQDSWYYDRSGIAGNWLFQPIGAVVRGQELLAVETEPPENAAYEIANIWIMETGEKNIRCFWNNAEFDIALPEEYSVGEEVRREQVADLSFRGGSLSKIDCKQEKISGKILSVGENMIEIEGEGTLFFTDNFKIYKLYGALERYYTSQLRVGYAFTDFVLEDGKVAACLVTKDEAMENIRVLIQAGNYSGIFHDNVSLTCDTGYEVWFGEEHEKRKAGERFEVKPDSAYFEKGGRILIKPDALTGRIRLDSVQRSQGTPEYRGTIEVVKNSDGMFVVNEVLLEEYLYAVVPSEMPSSYPMEALKAQAVCARTYAYRKMLHAGLLKYGAHVDDSTTYQVYNNILEHTETTRAVKETKGQLLYVGEEEADTYYYSTSCGFGTDASVWKGGDSSGLAYLVPRHIAAEGGSEEENEAADITREEVFAAYITTVHEEDYESSQPWYRWEYTVEQLDSQVLLERIRTRYQNNSSLILTREGDGYVSREIEKLGEIRDIRVEKRGAGGIIEELVIEGSENTVKVITEHNVRYVLCNPAYDSVVRQDGSRAGVSSLLPSSFFIINPGKEKDSVVGYKIVGGGFGHGVGMSQNAAKEMAAKGMECDQILSFFYKDAAVREIMVSEETDMENTKAA